MSSSEDEFDAVTDVLLELIKLQGADLQKKKKEEKEKCYRASNIFHYNRVIYYC